MTKSLPSLFAFFCFLTFSNSFIYAQTLAVEWQKTIGGSLADGTGCFNCTPTTAKITPDGGYILAGSSQSPVSGLKTENSRGGYDYWVVKLDSARNIQWQKVYGGDNDDRFKVLSLTLEGGYIIGGYSASGATGDKTDPGYGPIAFPDMWILKLSATGTIEWQQTLGGYYSDVPQSIVQNADSSYIIGAFSGSDSTGNKTTHLKSSSSDYWVVKLSPSGNILWQKDYGGQSIYSSSTLTSLNKTADGGYIIGGISLVTTGINGVGNDKTDTSRGGNDYWIIKTDANGIVQWDKTFGGSASDQLASVQQTNDKGYLLTGYSTSDSTGDKTENTIGLTGQDDYWIIKLDSTGTIQWQNTIGGYNSDYAKAAQQTNDGGYVIGGFSDSPVYADKTVQSMQYDYWLVKLDATGNVQWDKTIQAQGDDFCTSIQQTTDTGYILFGGSPGNIMYDKTENSYGSTDYWLLKVKPSVTVSIAEVETNANSLFVYPNPASNKITVELNLQGDETIQNIVLIDMQGKLSGNKFDNSRKKEIDIADIPTGIYLLKVNTNKQQLIKNIIVER